jgi:hypothetical protein
MKKKSLWRSKFVCRTTSSAVIVFAFVVTACFYFSFYYNMSPSTPVVSGRAEWRVPAAGPEEVLPFRSDVDRFLQVYFEQPFQKSEDKRKFVEHELARFSDYSVDNDTDRMIQNIFISALQRVWDKLGQGNADLSEEDATLIALEKNL